LRKYRIRDLREDMDYLQKDLAKVLNVTQQQYSNIENEVSVITAEDLIKLAKFYNVSVDYILRLTNNVNYSKNIEKVHDKVAS
jgi:transcriptional regulator with XRE-family HTH domain